MSGVLVGQRNLSIHAMTKREVTRERKLAYQHVYNNGEDSIASYFLKMRPNISKYG